MPEFAQGPDDEPTIKCLLCGAVNVMELDYRYYGRMQHDCAQSAAAWTRKPARPAVPAPCNCGSDDISDGFLMHHALWCDSMQELDPTFKEPPSLGCSEDFIAQMVANGAPPEAVERVRAYNRRVSAPPLTEGEAYRMKPVSMEGSIQQLKAACWLVLAEVWKTRPVSCLPGAAELAVSCERRAILLDAEWISEWKEQNDSSI